MLTNLLKGEPYPPYFKDSNVTDTIRKKAEIFFQLLMELEQNSDLNFEIIALTGDMLEDNSIVTILSANSYEEAYQLLLKFAYEVEIPTFLWNEMIADTNFETLADIQDITSMFNNLLQIIIDGWTGIKDLKPNLTNKMNLYLAIAEKLQITYNIVSQNIINNEPSVNPSEGQKITKSYYRFGK